MHQDEWLSALRRGEYVQSKGEGTDAAKCVIKVAESLVEHPPKQNYLLTFMREYGVSLELAIVLFMRNDGLGQPAETFDEIADWFKAQRDTHDGELSNWTRA
jgi:hypothetical protein